MKSPRLLKKITGYQIFLAIGLMILISFLYLFETVKIENEGATVVGQFKAGVNVGQTSQLYAHVTPQPGWVYNGFKGAQYDGVIVNNFSQPIRNWEVQIKVPVGSWIDSSWNGVYQLKSDTITLTAVDYNPIIKPNSHETTFGFVMYTPEDFEVSDIRISGHKVIQMKDYGLYWILLGSTFLLGVALMAYAIVDYQVSRYKLQEAKDKQMIIQSLNTFANFIDAKDSYTKGHSTRVAHFSKEIAKRMGLKEGKQEELYYIALLHDVGKIGVRSEILDKPSQLTKEEFAAIQMHTVIGEEILKDFTALNGIAEGAKYHHEKFDGTGYPEGLSGKEIPLYARIICVADAYDAMASDRYYRKRLSDELIWRELERCSGTQFDPEIVIHMLSMIQDGFVSKINEIVSHEMV